MSDRELELENLRLREALTWACGFIQCQVPTAVERYPDMRNALSLMVKVGQLYSGEFHLACIRAELAEARVRYLEARLKEWQGMTLAEIRRPQRVAPEGR